ncbi:MAG TPA: ABC transporter substrate-binding protein, partial [Chloroflexota bacterium]|nr:ABC transporter substrate-binding protein [Chloroflexota bacterium]
MSGRLIRSRFVLTLAAATAASILTIGCAQTAAPAATTAPAKPAAPAAAATTAPAAPAATSASAPAAVQPAGGEVKIGVLLPLSGGSASVGVDLKNALELAAEIVNSKNDLTMPLAKDEGLPGLGGAKVRLVI